MSKNYCSEHEVKQTVFDLKDRTKALLLLVAIIIGVQYLLKVFF